MPRLGRYIVALPAGRRTKWLVLIAWLIAIVAAVPLASKLSDVNSDGSIVEMPRGAEATQVAELASRFPDGKVSVGIVVYARSSGLTTADRTKVDADRQALASLATEQIQPPVASADGQASILIVPLKKDAATLADQAGKVRTRVRAQLPAGMQVKLTGPAGNSLDASDANQRTNALVTLVTLGVIAFLLLIIYRSPFLWLLPLINVGIALFLMRAVEYLFGRYAGMAVDPENATVLTVLMFGVGTDYALLLLARYRDELGHRPDRHEAMTYALRGAVPAIVASAATVALGLLCLLAADMGFNYTLGTAGAIAIVCALLATVTLLPALLVIFGRWMFWPKVPRTGAVAQRRTSLWERTGRVVATRPRVVWIVTVLLLCGLALGISGMKTGLTDKEAIAGTPESVAGQQVLAAHFPAGQSRPVAVVANAGAAAGVREALRSLSGVASVRSPVASTDSALVRIDAVLSDPTDSAAGEATVDRIRTAAHAVPGADAKVGGATAERMERDAAQAHDRKVVIPLVLVVVFVVLILLLRALVGPLLLMGTVVLSYGAALGGSWWLFDLVFGFPAVDTQLALVGFLFLVALGVDYNIFLISRVREEAVRHGHRSGVLRGLTTTGGVITSAGVVLAATFAALNLAPQVAFKEVGLLVAVGVLLDTLVVRSVLVPALSLDVGRRFWWPSRLGRHTPDAGLPVSDPDTPVRRGRGDGRHQTGAGQVC
jgi:RND superfamily putative drug exporter